MRPPTASASTAAGRARSSASSSPFTSMRSAWKGRLAGCPPLRRAGGGGAGGGGTGPGGGGPFPHHGVGYLPGELLLAVVAQHLAQPGRRIGVEDLRGRQRLALVHPHVERGVVGVGESPLRLVELRRRHPEVEKETVGGA